MTPTNTAQPESDAIREAVAAALWRAEVVDAGVPNSIVSARTPAAFWEELDQTRERWFKFADAALAAAPPHPAPPVEGLREALADMERRKDGAYEERNMLVAALAKMFPSGICKTDIPGWSDDWHGCVRIDLPTGQVSWHYHDSQAHLFADLPAYAGEWDGHDTPEKYRRLAALSAPAPPAEPVAPSDAGVKAGIYVASKTKHAGRWKEFRANGWPINSTWIDEAGVGESGDLADLWRRCIAEASSAAVLVVYREPGDVLKGGWVEVGAALASGVPVYAVGLDGFTIAHDTRIQHFETLDTAMVSARTYVETLAPPAPTAPASDDREKMVEALRMCQRALAMMVDPSSIDTTTVATAFATAMEAEHRARAALGTEESSR